MQKKDVRKRVDAAANYIQELQPKERERYLRKIEIISGEDPYAVTHFSSDWVLLPRVTVIYLLFTH